MTAELEALVAQQCELIGELQERVDELENVTDEAPARLEGYLSETCRMSPPVRIDNPELRALAEVLF